MGTPVSDTALTYPAIRHSRSGRSQPIPPRGDGSHVSPVRTRSQFDPATRLVNDELEKYEEETKNLEFLANVNHVIEKHKNDPTPKPHKISPDHPDLVQHDDAPGFWHPDVTPEERVKMMAEMKDLMRHDKQHGEPGILDPDCRWCDQSVEMNRCPKTGCMAGLQHSGEHLPWWDWYQANKDK